MVDGHVGGAAGGVIEGAVQIEVPGVRQGGIRVVGMGGARGIEGDRAAFISGVRAAGIGGGEGQTQLGGEQPLLGSHVVGEGGQGRYRRRLVRRHGRGEVGEVVVGGEAREVAGQEVGDAVVDVLLAPAGGQQLHALDGGQAAGAHPRLGGAVVVHDGDEVDARAFHGGGYRGKRGIDPRDGGDQLPGIGLRLLCLAPGVLATAGLLRSLVALHGGE